MALCTDKSSRLSQDSGLPGVCTQVGVQHSFVLVTELNKLKYCWPERGERSHWIKLSIMPTRL